LAHIGFFRATKEPIIRKCPAGIQAALKPEKIVMSAGNLLSPSAYHHPLVRDLCWTLASEFDLLAELPPFQRFHPLQPPALLADWLRNLDADPRQLEAFFSGAPQQRLGRHFEKLVLFHLQHAPANPLQLLEHNRPVMGKSAGGRDITLGELDFLLAEAHTKIHLEVAVKFYLGVTHTGATHWLGPSLDDRLTRKLQHLRDNQLPLSQVLQIEPVERRFWVKGVLFHPGQTILDLPDGIIPPRQTSFWLTCSQATQSLELSEWIGLPKARWLGCGLEGLDGSATADQLRTYFAAATPGRALMLWNNLRDARCLVVADDWPVAAQSTLRHLTVPQ
jgi:hypothetical protein